MPSTSLAIINKLGLHARASSKLTQTASRFNSDIWLSHKGKRINAKSIMGVMMLAAGKGSTVELEAIGDDAEAAIHAISELVGDYFGEGG